MTNINTATTNKFNDWIKQNYPTKESAKLQCSEATNKMIQVFPEIERIRGYVYVGLNYVPHWWCVDINGNIIDPTAHQWFSPPLLYEPISDDEEEPHGKCLNCGALLYRSRGAESYYCEDCK
jgi:hypothetical protein